MISDQKSRQTADTNAGKAVKIKVYIALTLVTVVLALLFGLNLMMKNLCETLIIERGLPRLEKTLQAKIVIGKISVNLLSGAVIIHNLEIGNPPGFDMTPKMARLPYIRIRFAWLDLWRKDTITIRSLRIKNAQLNLIRNSDNKFNLPALVDVKPSGSGQADQPDDQTNSVMQEPARKSDRHAAPNLTLDKLRLTGRIRYSDHHPVFGGKPLKLALELKILAHGIANHGQPDQLTGNLLVDGMITTADQRIPMEMRGKIAPITAPDQLTFELTGATGHFDLRGTPPLAYWLGLEQGKITCTMLLDANRGIFDPEKSILKFDFDDVELTAGSNEQTSGLRLPRTFSLTAPISGNVESPDIDFAAAVAGLLSGSDVISSLLQDIYNATGSKKSD